MIKFLCLGCVLFSSLASVAPWKVETRRIWQTAFNGFAAACMLLCWLQTAELFWFVPLMFWGLIGFFTALGSREKSLWYLQTGLLLGVIALWTWDWLFPTASGTISQTQAQTCLYGFAQP